VNQQEREQMSAGFRDMAMMLYDYTIHLTSIGYTRSEAIQLTISMQANMLAQIPKK